jgi:hypothetical protein
MKNKINKHDVIQFIMVLILISAITFLIINIKYIK